MPRPRQHPDERLARRVALLGAAALRGVAVVVRRAADALAGSPVAPDRPPATAGTLPAAGAGADGVTTPYRVDRALRPPDHWLRLVAEHAPGLLRDVVAAPGVDGEAMRGLDGAGAAPEPDGAGAPAAGPAFRLPPDDRVPAVRPASTARVAPWPAHRGPATATSPEEVRRSGLGRAAAGGQHVAPAQRDTAGVLPGVRPATASATAQGHARAPVRARVVAALSRVVRPVRRAQPPPEPPVPALSPAPPAPPPVPALCPAPPVPEPPPPPVPEQPPVPAGRPRQGRDPSIRSWSSPVDFVAVPAGRPRSGPRDPWPQLPPPHRVPATTGVGRPRSGATAPAGRSPWPDLPDDAELWHVPAGDGPAERLAGLDREQAGA